MSQQYVGLLAVVLMCWGGVAIAAPRTLERFMLRLSGIAQRSAPNPDATKHRLFLPQRLIGFLAFATGAFMLQVVLRTPHYKHFTTIQPQALSQRTVIPSWPIVLFDAGGVILGLLLVLKPQILRKMIASNFPSHRLPLETDNSTATAGRLLGASLMLIEMFNLSQDLYAWFKITH